MTASAKTAGFTLIEVMVALFIVTLALSALLFQMMGAVENTAYLRDKMLAGWVADNQLAWERIVNRSTNQILTAEKTGDVEMAQRQWFWTITPVKTAAEGFMQLHVAVSVDNPDNEPLVTLVGFVDQFHRQPLVE